MDRYVGIPFVERRSDFAGCDCWGLYRLVFREERGIELPDCAELESTQAPLYLSGWRQVQEPEPFDLLLFRVAEGYHGAMLVAPGTILHTTRGKASCIERINRWERRLTGIYRWQ